MKIEWSPEAAADFAGIVAYIREQNPSAADRVAHTMYDSAASLESFPNRESAARITTLAIDSGSEYARGIPPIAKNAMSRAPVVIEGSS
jgi:plasmid stabilization system protein ParE